MPTIDMTKKAGPSPESANLKSRPQFSQRGRKVRKPEKRGPLPQLGQQPFNPVRIGEGAAGWSWVTWVSRRRRAASLSLNGRGKKKGGSCRPSYGVLTGLCQLGLISFRSIGVREQLP